MKIPFTRARAACSVPRVCLVWGIVGSFTGGCVRELSDLTQAVLPAVDAAVPDAGNDGATGVAVPRDADTHDAGSRDAAAAVVVSTSAYDAAVIQEAGYVVVDAGYSSSPEPATSNDAGFGASSAAPTHTTDAGGETRDVDAGFDAGARGERRPFDVAQPFEPGDAGLGVVPLFPAVGVVVDGSSSEWSDAGWLWIATPDMSIGQPQSANDLSAALAVRWDASALFLLVAVMDEHHDNDSGGFDIWGGDSIQVAFDVGQGRLPYDWEYGFAKTTQGLVAHRWREGDADLSSDMDFAVVRDRGVTVYEVAFEARHLGVHAFPVDVLRLSVAVNDNDGQERSAALELVQGIVGTKSAERFALAAWQQ